MPLVRRQKPPVQGMLPLRGNRHLTVDAADVADVGNGEKAPHCIGHIFRTIWEDPDSSQGPPPPPVIGLVAQTHALVHGTVHGDGGFGRMGFPRTQAHTSGGLKGERERRHPAHSRNKPEQRILFECFRRKNEACNHESSARSSILMSAGTACQTKMVVATMHRQCCSLEWLDNNPRRSWAHNNPRRWGGGRDSHPVGGAGCSPPLF